MIVYIGRTDRFPLRFNLTNSSFIFDRIRFIECSYKDSISYERRWIKKFDPIYNKAYTPRYKKHSSGGGRKVYTIMDELNVGEIIPLTNNSSPRGSVLHFNRTRQYKKINFYKKDGKYFIERIQ